MGKGWQRDGAAEDAGAPGDERRRDGGEDAGSPTGVGRAPSEGGTRNGGAFSPRKPGKASPYSSWESAKGDEEDTGAIHALLDDDAHFDEAVFEVDAGREADGEAGTARGEVPPASYHGTARAC